MGRHQTRFEPLDFIEDLLQHFRRAVIVRGDRDDTEAGPLPEIRCATSATDTLKAPTRSLMRRSTMRLSLSDCDSGR